MKRRLKNLLPRIVFEGVALNLKLSKIKLGLPKRVSLLAIFAYSLFTFLGYYPTFSIPPIKQHQIFAQTQQQKGEVIASSFSKPLILPHPGYLTTRFSNYHPGIDIAAGLGMPIHPVIDGVAEEAGFNIWGLGNYVVVAHENGFKSKYSHMGKIYVKKGDKVTSENILGEVGLTGRTSGPHTHLEITLNGQFVDPLKILPEISDLPVETPVKK
ncbi:M23 family metallopeptidase [Candidatus Daviesbacteria bacterium]|nr:M23 family metallopeptidase [Candidatus Daviesbacteria bacterium]